MNVSMIVKEEVIFASDIEKVWDLLVNPEMTKQYMFGCELVSDWKLGSPVYWKGRTEDNQEVVYVKGEVLEFKYFQKIVTTTFDPNSGMADIPQNYVNLSYELKPLESGTQLTIVQGDYKDAENGQQRFEETRTGWSEIVIPIMKKLLSE